MNTDEHGCSRAAEFERGQPAEETGETHFLPGLPKLGRGATFGLGALFLFALALAGYWPVLRGEFVWDDLLLVAKNPLVTGQFGLTSLWFQTDFPLATVALWFQWLAWGKQAAGYHLVNVLLHAVNSLLVWRLLGRMKVPGAWLAGALFAVHPVAVASAAWISEQKNTLSLAFYLVSFMGYLRSSESKVQSPKSKVQSPESKVQSPESKVQSPKSGVQSPKSGVQSPGSGVQSPGSGVQRPKSRVRSPGSEVQSLVQAALDPQRSPLVPPSTPDTRHPTPDPRPSPLAPRPSTPASRPSSLATPSPVWYCLALAAFVLALLCKTSTVMLPVVLLLWTWWERGRMTRRDWLRTGPFFVLALAFGLMTVWFQAHQVITGLSVQTESFGARLAAAGRAVWFYLAKAILPLNLNLIYPRWEINAAAPAAFLPLLLLVAAGFVCWWFRRGWGRHALFGLGCFAVNLFPALGFFDMYYLAISRVSDHFAYLPLVAVVAMVAAGLAQIRNSKSEARKQSEVQHPKSEARKKPEIRSPKAEGVVGTLAAVDAGAAPDVAVAVRPSDFGLLSALGFRPSDFWRVSVAVGLVAVLGILSAQRARVFATDEGLWRDTLAKNPAAWTAHNNLACILAEQQHLGQAIEHFEASLRLNPNNAGAQANLGQALALRGNFAAAEPHFRAALALKPDKADAHKLFAAALAEQGRTREALAHYREGLRLEPDNSTRVEYAALLARAGYPGPAVAEYRRTLAAEPDLPEPLNNLAWLLATCADPTVRNGAEAVRLAQRACRLTADQEPTLVGTLAAAYAEAGRFPEAIAAAQRAVELATTAGNQQFAALNQQLLRLYRAGRAYHEESQRH